MAARKMKRNSQPLKTTRQRVLGANKVEIDYLDFCRYYPYTPTALCIRECIRLTKLSDYSCTGPILDVGCGDGLFAQIAFRSSDVWGIDIDANEGRWAQASRAYSQIVIGDVVEAVLPESFFKSCVANCSLEHVPDIEGALHAIYRSLVPDSTAYLFVPAHDWTESLRSVRIARRIAPWLAGAISSGIDGVFNHHHLYDESTWAKLAENAGFEVVEVSPIGSVAATQAFEAFLPASLLGLWNKKLTSRWTLFPKLRAIGALPTFLAVQAVLRASSEDTPTAEYFLALRKPAEAS